ncbi:hypothetical protein AB0M00_31455 [Streptomyces chartreusis]|uniref:hypothetical protein n=1 Tax=Streptomyces chartreusis TaxID=1969 RepID=UPI0034463D87
MKREDSDNPLDAPEGAELVKSQYMNLRTLCAELKDLTSKEKLDGRDWEIYARDLAKNFRGLDLLLTQGAPFPEEWVLGITTP